MYWLRIHTQGSEDDYLEFHSGGNPMPRFTIARQNAIKDNGELAGSEYTFRLRLFYPNDKAQLWLDFAALEAKMDGAIVDLRLYDVPPGGTPNPGNLVREWLASDDRYINSPQLQNLAQVDRRGSWATGLTFDMDVRIEEGDPNEPGVKNKQRQITWEREQGKETVTLDITAEGPNAKDALDSFKAEYDDIAGTDYNFEREVWQIDRDTWQGTWTVKQASGAGGGGVGVATISERISVEGGGRDVSFSKVTGDNDPVKFVGPRREVMVTINGTVIADEQKQLIYPNRDAYPGHVPDDVFDMGSSQDAKVTGRPTEFTGNYTQIFKLPNKEELPKLLKIVDLQSLAAATAKNMMAGKPDATPTSSKGKGGPTKKNDPQAGKNKAQAGTP
jgi:hypothetical protein